ncbi:thiol reductant ABC exporter subunit CydC [Streptomyces sp. NPDC014773]|uniref:thiol reductant ABC exporter subunit CydC n=1 Tax=Streptomyces sp. NPDC014773 TaxID=3364908 RepID=UPI003700702D
MVRTKRPGTADVRHAGPGYRGRTVWAVACGVLATWTGLGLTAAAAWLITRAAGQPPLSALSLAIVAVRACATLKGVFRYGERLAGHDVALRAQAAERGRLFAALAPAGPVRRGGDLLSRMVSDSDAVQDLLVRCLLPAVGAAAGVTGALAVAVWLLPAAVPLVAAGLLTAALLVPAVAAATARRWARRTAPARAELAARTADLAHGADDLAAYGATGRALAAAAGAAERLTALERRRARAQAAATAVAVLVQGLTVLAVVLLARRHDAGQVTTAVLALATLVGFEPVLPLPRAAEDWVTARAALRRLRGTGAAAPEPTSPNSLESLETLETPESPQSAKTPRSSKSSYGGLPAVPGAVPEGPCTVRVEDLTVRYRPGAAPALDGVGLMLRPGRRIAVVGPSGSGKSTLLGALAGLVTAERGGVVLTGGDGRDHRAGAGPEGEAVRRVMTGLVTEPYVFQASLRDNLVLARPDADEAEVAEALAVAGLTEWAGRTGWDTVLREDGGSVSGGQLQRVALARAVLRNPPVLLLDEPTEALDPETADAVTARLLARPAGDRTTVWVTHRLSGLAAADEIVVLEGGRVTQHGTHDELVAGPGYYRDAWECELLAGGLAGAGARRA